MKVLIIGPLNEPITGVSVSNDLLEKRLHADSINTSLPFFEENVGRFSLKKVFINLKFYSKIFKIFRADVVYLTTGQSFFGVFKYAPYIFLGAFLNKQVVIHLHGNLLFSTYTQLSGLKKFLFKSVLKHCTKGIVLSNSLKRNLLPFLPQDKIFSISNFVESKFILPKEEISRKPLEDLNIIYLSNLMTEKGVFVFFETLALLKEKGVNYKCKMAGNIDDRLRNDIFKQIENDLSIEYLGVVKGEIKRDLLEWGRIFVFPSIQVEGLPLTILEAMGSGNHIISTRHDALMDLFSKKEINFVEVGSSRDIFNLITNNDFDNSQLFINYNRILDEFGEDHFVNNILNVFKSK